MISNATIERIQDATRIEDVIGEFVTLKKAGSTLKACCPFHTERTPSFSVNPARGIFKCFGCGEGGDAVTFLMKQQRITYPEALRWLASRYSIEVEQTAAKPDPEWDEKVRIRATLAAVQAHFTAQDTSPGREYWKKRGFTDETLNQFGIGYCADGGVPLVDSSALIAAGIANVETGNLSAWKRSTIPIYDKRGQLASFSGRLIDEKKPDAAKYINGRETAAYQKKALLFNLHQAAGAIRGAGEVWVVEGYADVMALWQAGVHNAVGICGTALTDEQVAILRPFNGDTPLRIYLAFDNETSARGENHKPAVEAAQYAALEKLLPLGEVRIVLYPKGCKDMCDVVMAGKFDLQAMKGRSAEAIPHFVQERCGREWTDTASAVEKADFQERIAALIARVKKESVRDIHIKQLSTLLETNTRALQEMVKRFTSSKDVEAINTVENYRHVKVCDTYLERQPKKDVLTGTVVWGYAQRKKEEIKEEFGRDYIRQIPRFVNYITQPDHLKYERVVKVKTDDQEFSFFNEYEPLPYRPVKFELPAGFLHDPENFDYEQIKEIENTARFFKHIYDHETYGNRFLKIGWDYLALMYLHPQQRLPAQALVSTEEGTGKSTMINLYMKFFGSNAVKTDASRIGAKFNSLSANKIFVGVEETKDEKGGIENILKDLITSFDRVVERKFQEAAVTPSFEKYMFASNHEDSFMKVGTETTRFFVSKVRAIANKEADFENKLFLEIPYVMHFLQVRKVLTPKTNRLWFEPALLENEALIKLRQASKDIIQQNMEELIAQIFLRSEYDQPVIRLTSELLKELMIGYGGRLYEQKTPNYFHKAAVESMRCRNRPNPTKFQCLKLQNVDPGKERWEYELRTISGRYIEFPVWRFVSPADFVDNYTTDRATALTTRIMGNLDAYFVDYGNQVTEWVDKVLALVDEMKRVSQHEPITEDLPF